MSQQGKDIPHSSSPVRAVSHKTIKEWRPRIGTMCYRGCYITGMRTIRLFKRSKRRIKRWFRPVEKIVYKAADVILLRHCRAVAAEAKRVAAGFPLAARRVRDAWRDHPIKGIGQALLLPFLAARRHRRALIHALNMAAPAAAAVALVVTLQYWGNQHFALALEVDGQQVGYIQDESVLDAAATMAEERVSADST